MGKRGSGRRSRGWVGWWEILVDEAFWGGDVRASQGGTAARASVNVHPGAGGK